MRPPGAGSRRQRSGIFGAAKNSRGSGPERRSCCWNFPGNLQPSGKQRGGRWPPGANPARVPSGEGGWTWALHRGNVWEEETLPHASTPRRGNGVRGETICMGLGHEGARLLAVPMVPAHLVQVVPSHLLQGMSSASQRCL